MTHFQFFPFLFRSRRDLRRLPLRILRALPTARSLFFRRGDVSALAFCLRRLFTERPAGLRAPSAPHGPQRISRSAAGRSLPRRPAGQPQLRRHRGRYRSPGRSAAAAAGDDRKAAPCCRTGGCSPASAPSSQHPGSPSCPQAVTPGNPSPPKLPPLPLLSSPHGHRGAPPVQNPGPLLLREHWWPPMLSVPICHCDLWYPADTRPRSPGRVSV